MIVLMGGKAQAVTAIWAQSANGQKITGPDNAESYRPRPQRKSIPGPFPLSAFCLMPNLFTWYSGRPKMGNSHASCNG